MSSDVSTDGQHGRAIKQANPMSAGSDVRLRVFNKLKRIRDLVEVIELPPKKQATEESLHLQAVLAGLERNLDRWARTEMADTTKASGSSESADTACRGEQSPGVQQVPAADR
eukprot:TRINITY_DN14276_c0_g1_i1.p2 TRINITY_DN14276_c0_g1~~TRINITY_DN14276_c0_g1_i1.p2  ORF type:complete len:113 (+),score=17.49 TRINITY_DN14276_c0_g1_i1:172-510(+)